MPGVTSPNWSVWNESMFNSGWKNPGLEGSEVLEVKTTGIRLCTMVP